MTLSRRCPDSGDPALLGGAFPSPPGCPCSARNIRSLPRVPRLCQPCLLLPRLIPPGPTAQPLRPPDQRSRPWPQALRVLAQWEYLLTFTCASEQVLGTL